MVIFQSHLLIYCWRSLSQKTKDLDSIQHMRAENRELAALRATLRFLYAICHKLLDE